MTEVGSGIATNTLVVALHAAIRTLQASVGDNSGVVHRLVGLRERLADSRLQLAVLGQFKRGKSTFINALLGAPLLPVAVIPLTAVPVFIAWRETPFIRVLFNDGSVPEELSLQEPDAIRDFLFRFVAEEANPENRLGVQRVDLFYPSPLLAGGTVLIDTPGVGSTHRHNTDAALAVLPECDAALFVVSTDPPITEAELGYLRHIKTKVARIFYILNKIDYLASDDREHVGKFLREVLAKNGLWTPVSEIFGVSARNGLEARQSGNRNELAASGMAAVEAHLIGQLATEKSDLLETAMRGKILDSLADGAAEIALRVQALKLPVAELTAKSKLFEVSLRSIEQRQRITRDVLAGEQRTIRQEIEANIASLRHDATAELARLLEGEFEPSEAEQMLSTTMERIFDSARVQLVEHYSRRTDSVLAGYQQAIDADVASVKRAAAQVFQTPFNESSEASAFALRHEPYWLTLEPRASLLYDSGRWLERLLPKAQRARRIRGRMLAQIDELVVRNAENLRWALLRGADETFRDATTNLQARLDDAVQATRGVIEEALVRRRDASFAIGANLERLNLANDTLVALRRRIGKGHAQGNSVS
jgi:Dynamin family